MWMVLFSRSAKEAPSCGIEHCAKWSAGFQFGPRAIASEPVSCCLEKWSHSLAVVAADGRFRGDSVRSGDYRISITDLPEGFYL